MSSQIAGLQENIRNYDGSEICCLQSKQDTRSHVFPPMKRKQRQAVHELAELYGCGTISYDDEPQRNVVATAQK